MPGNAAIAQLAALAQAAQGIPQQGAIPEPAMGAAAAEGDEDIQKILLRLRAGQMSAGQLLQLVAALVGQGGPQQPQMQPQQGPLPEEMAMQGGGGMGGSPAIEQAFAGQ